ncbi:acetate--CoA ligase family protein [Chloroflexota bacterium]
MLDNWILKQARHEKRVQLTEVESKELLRGVGIPIIEARLVRTKQEAVSLSKEIGFPVVLKVASPDIIHKSDAGGVKLGLNSATQVGNAYSHIMASTKLLSPGFELQGVSVQRMAPPGVEVIIGMSKDAQFGPVIMFGLGGVLVELLGDVAFRISPLTEEDAAEMIREIKGFPLLQGFRGREVVDVSALEKLIVKVSEFVDQNPEIKELDLNPVFAYKVGAVAVDVRIILEPAAES